MLIIGEKINTATKSVRNAIMEKDVNFLQTLAKSQEESGADYIDVNVSTERGSKFDIESMQWAVEKIQEGVTHERARYCTKYTNRQQSSC